MDTSPTPGQAIRLLLDINRTPDGRLEGQIRAGGTGTWKPFSGVLELLKALEETYCIEGDARNAAKEGTPS
ncbi:MAG TPA: hypothetical protein VKO16_00355 [Polyangia bacterium]|nr:hypothetical protein [Polyangia bacterium]